MKAEKVRRALYALESKLEAVQLVQSGQSCAETAKVLGMPSQTLENWVRQAAKSQLADAGAKPVGVEQVELTRLRAGHASPYAEQLGDGCAQDGLVQTTTRIRTHLPFGSRQSG